MTEMLRLIHAEGVHAAQVEQVEVGTNHNMLNALIRHQPKDGLQAKFSMEYCMAILLLDGKAGLNEFTDAVVNRPDAQEMIKRVRFYTDPEAEAAGYDKMTTIIKIHLKDGRTINGKADYGKGSPANPMSYDEVADKFRGCASYAGWPETKTGKIIEFVRTLDAASDLHALAELCSK
jgi:2-methylcitrate dehydratase PrpD